MKTGNDNEKWYLGKYLSKYLNDALKAYWSEYSLEGLVINPTPDSQKQAYDVIESSLQEVAKSAEHMQKVIEEAKTNNEEIQLDNNENFLVGGKSIEEISLQPTHNSNKFAKAWSEEILKTKIDTSPKIDYSQLFNGNNDKGFSIENPIKEVKQTNPKQINSPNSIKSSKKRFELAYERFRGLPELKYFEPFNEKGEINSLSEHINNTQEEYKNANEVEKENLKEKRAEINILLSNYEPDKIQEIINEYESAKKQYEIASKETQNQTSNQQKLNYYKPKSNPLDKGVKFTKKLKDISDKEINELLKEREINEYNFAQKIHDALENQNNTAGMTEQIQQDLKDLKALTKKTIKALEKNEKYQSKIAELNINLKNYDMLEGVNPNIELSKPAPLKQEFNLSEVITPKEIPSPIIETPRETQQENLSLNIDKGEIQLNDPNISPTSTNDTRAFSPTNTTEEREIEVNIKEEPKVENLPPEELSMKQKMAMFGGTKKTNNSPQPETTKTPGKLGTSIFGAKVGDKTPQISSTTTEQKKTTGNSAALDKLRNLGKTTAPLQQQEPSQKSVSKWSTPGQRVDPKRVENLPTSVISSTETTNQQQQILSVKERIAKLQGK